MNLVYEWQRPYVTAILETDRSKLRQHIAAADGSIQARIRELSQDHGGTPEERLAIRDALDGLKVLRKEIAA
jgi:hypothetical protein